MLQERARSAGRRPGDVATGFQSGGTGMALALAPGLSP